MTNEEKILKALEALQQGQQAQGKMIDTIRADVTSIKSTQQEQGKLLQEQGKKIDSVDMKVEAFNLKLDTTAKEIKETIEREAKATADVFFDTLEKQGNLEKRTEQIEKHLHLPQL